MERVGWIDRGVLSEYLFCTITDHENDREVVGKIANHSEVVTSMWQSRMEQDNMDDKTPWTALLQSGGLGQISDSFLVEAFKGRTHYTKAQTKQIWTGSAPIQLELELEFVALSNPAVEVGQPLPFLQMMVSPQLKPSFIASYTPIINETITSLQSGVAPDPSILNDILGFIPNEVTVTLYEHLFVAQYIITSCSSSDSEMLIHKNGDKIKRTISLSLSSTESLNKDDIVPLTLSQQLGLEGSV